MRDGDSIEIRKAANGWIVELDTPYSENRKKQRANEDREYKRVFIGITAALAWVENEMDQAEEEE